jgi:hypothetical protein
MKANDVTLSMNKNLSTEVAGAIADVLRETAAQPEADTVRAMPLSRRVRQNRADRSQAFCSSSQIFFQTPLSLDFSVPDARKLRCSAARWSVSPRASKP